MSLLTAVAFAAVGCAAGTSTGNGTQDTPARNDALSADVTGPATELVRVTGTVVTGEQDGCVLLDTGFTTYVLLGGDKAVIEDAVENEDEVTVTGQANATTPATTCTEGTPLAIQKFTPAT
jgi:hypothetical protein